MPTTLIEEIDGWAGRSEVNRSEAIRRLIELGLKAKAGKS
jgi:metal-responsive CopG/Arc/MetJ family transcriptional regulator